MAPRAMERMAVRVFCPLRHPLTPIYQNAQGHALHDDGLEPAAETVGGDLLGGTAGDGPEDKPHSGPGQNSQRIDDRSGQHTLRLLLGDKVTDYLASHQQSGSGGNPRVTGGNAPPSRRGSLQLLGRRRLFRGKDHRLVEDAPVPQLLPHDPGQRAAVGL